MISFKNFLTEGGNVFAGKTAGIALENIKPTLANYFAELKKIFPRKAAIFNETHFVPLGSVGKKAVSGDIDLGVDARNLLDHEMSDKSIAEWGLDPRAVAVEAEKLAKAARTSTAAQVRMKAFLKLLTRHINAAAPTLHCDEKKVTYGNIFGLYPQITPSGNPVGIGVQIDWMIGDLKWLTFSYASAAYPAGSNVKGLHRTQLMLSAFQVAGFSFNHVSGVKDHATGEIIAQDPDKALEVLGKKLGFTITQSVAHEYYSLHKLFKSKMRPADYNHLLDVYFRILDSTRADIPDDLQGEWLKRKARLGLTGKFLPDNSALKSTGKLVESGSTGADRIKSRAHFDQFLNTYKKVISQFPGFVSISPSGSYNSDKSKEDFGDIDLITHIKTNKDKALLKRELAAYLEKLPDSVVVPFSSTRYAGRRSLNTGEIVTIRYQDPQLGYSVQIDNIIAIEKEEADFKQKFLDWPAEKQGLILGLIKVATIENPIGPMFASLRINQPHTLPPLQEYEFNLSSSELQLRINKYHPGTFKLESKRVVWTSRNFEDVKKVLFNYNIDTTFEDLLHQAKHHIKNARSKLRIPGVFGSMITVKSGEIGTPKGEKKTQSLQKVRSTFNESKSFKSYIQEPKRTIVFTFGRMQPPTIGHGLLIQAVTRAAREKKCDHVVFLSKSNDHLKNPLPIDVKLKWAKIMFPGVHFQGMSSEFGTIIDIAKALSLQYNNLVMVAGADRVESFKTLLNKYNGDEYDFDSIEVISAGERDPDSDSVDGMSGTKMRHAARDNNLAAFKRGLPPTMRGKEEQLLKDVRTGMKL